MCSNSQKYATDCEYFPAMRCRANNADSSISSNWNSPTLVLGMHKICGYIEPTEPRWYPISEHMRSFMRHNMCESIRIRVSIFFFPIFSQLFLNVIMNLSVQVDGSGMGYRRVDGLKRTSCQSSNSVHRRPLSLAPNSRSGE